MDFQLSFANQTPMFKIFILLVAMFWKLHKNKWKFRIIKIFTPILNHRSKKFCIHLRFVIIAFTLIPDYTLQSVRSDARKHAIVKSSRTIWIFTWFWTWPGIFSKNFFSLFPRNSRFFLPENRIFFIPFIVSFFIIFIFFYLLLDSFSSSCLFLFN